jgi:hypothetical protein
MKRNNMRLLSAGAALVLTALAVGCAPTADATTTPQQPNPGAAGSTERPNQTGAPPQAPAAN